jgi:hypothetical protein
MSGSIRMLSLDAKEGPMRVVVPKRQESRSGLYRANDWPGPAQVDDTAFRVRQRPRLLAHLAYPYSHPRKMHWGNRTAPRIGPKTCRWRPRPSSTTASAYVIRPDRDMRQFDGSIV